MVMPISLERSFEHMVLRKTEFFILYWLNGEELQDCIRDNYDEATNRFDYLKVNWQFIFPYGLLRSSWLISILIQLINSIPLLTHLIDQI